MEHGNCHVRELLLQLPQQLVGHSLGICQGSVQELLGVRSICLYIWQWMFEHLVITLHLLSDDALLDYIRASHYDVAIVDLIQNECMLALPVSMGVPVVAFWVTIPIGIVHLTMLRTKFQIQCTTKPK